MTKSELIDEIAAQTPEIQRRDFEIIVNAIFDTMSSALSKQQRIEIRGFGAFVAKARKARVARNPRTGAKVDIPSKWVPFFTAGKELKERINQTKPVES